MKSADEPPLTDQDRLAIEEIRRQLDRDLGPPWPEPDGSAAIASSDHEPAAATGPTEPKRGGRGLRLALSAGAVMLGAAVIGALMSIADLSGQSARSPVSTPQASDVITPIPTEMVPAPAGAMDARESATTEVQAESARRVVPGAERATTRASAAGAPSGDGHRRGRVDAGPPGRGGVEAQHRQWHAASVTHYRTEAPVGLRPARSVPLTTVQAP
jgi:hypothetical protein